MSALCPLLTAHCSLHYSQSICHCSLSILVTTHCSLHLGHCTLLTAHCPMFRLQWETVTAPSLLCSLSRGSAVAWKWYCHREYIEKRAVRGWLCSLLTATALFWCHEQRAAHTWTTPQQFPGGIVWDLSFVQITMSEAQQDIKYQHISEQYKSKQNRVVKHYTKEKNNRTQKKRSEQSRAT